MVFSSKKGLQYIDPTTNDGHDYIVYKKSELPELADSHICEVVDEVPFKNDLHIDELLAKNPDDGKLRTFRLAVATTVEYSAFPTGSELQFAHPRRLHPSHGVVPTQHPTSTRAEQRGGTD